MPMLGVGTFGVPENMLTTVTQCAASLGAYYIDSAYRYENESCIGQLFERGDLERSKVLLGTKLSYSQQMKSEIYKAVDESLNNLKTDYIDLYFIHSPKSNTFCSDWNKLLSIRKMGKIRELAVSNFGIDQLDQLYRDTGTYPTLNQIEIHLGFYPEDVIQYCKRHNIAVQASCPLGQMTEKLLKKEEFIMLSNKYHKSFAQLSLRWLLQKDILSIPRTSNIEHLKENYAIFDFEINQADMKLLDNSSKC